MITFFVLAFGIWPIVAVGVVGGRRRELHGIADVARGGDDLGREAVEQLVGATVAELEAL